MWSGASISMEPSDLKIIAISVQVLGIYFLALSTVFKKPRRVVEEVIGASRGSLRPVKDYLFRMKQLMIGVVLLIAGYGLQVYSLVSGAGASNSAALSFFAGWSHVAVMTFLAACITVTGVLLHLITSVLAKRSFKRLIISFVKEQKWEFEDNMKLTKEIGEIIGVPMPIDSSIEEYVVQVKRRLKLVS